MHFLNFTTFVWKMLHFKTSVNNSAIFTSQFMSNHITKMTEFSIEINGNLHFSQIWRGEQRKEVEDA